jgi:hypothetical protein
MSYCASIFCCSSLRLSIDSFLFIVAHAPGHVKMCCQSSSLCSQKQHCIILPWLHLFLSFMHQKLKCIFVSLGCHAAGVLWNVILKDFHLMSSRVFWLHVSLYFLCSSSVGRWKLCATFRVIFDFNFFPWRQRENCCYCKCKLSC